MLTIRDFWRQGAMRGIESAAARQAIAEARRRWLPILEACAERDEDGGDEHVDAEIRRLRRLLGLPPAEPSPKMVERRRQQVRDRVRRFRERRASEAVNRPRRVQQRRTPGWRKPPGAVSVVRGTRWGNPFKIPDDGDRAEVVAKHEEWFLGRRPSPPGWRWDPAELLAALPELRGKDLMCWCPFGEACHADLLLRLANRSEVP